MKNITLSADENLIASAGPYAQAHGTTLNELIRDYLKVLANPRDPNEVADEFLREALEQSGLFRGGLAVQPRRNSQTRELDVTKVFLDTNILVYANDHRDRRKQAIAARLLSDCIRQHTRRDLHSGVAGISLR